MKLPIGYANYDTYEVVTVLEITPKAAMCKTNFGSDVVVEWKYNLPDETPAVGETWVVKKSRDDSWSFVSRFTSGEYNVMRYAMIADARDCIGKDRSIIDDIAAIGLDEVYLVCCSGGVALWQSEVAEKYGIKVFSDYLTPVVDRLNSAGIPITFVLDTDMFGAGSEYNQVDSSGNVHTAISYSAAGSAVADIVGELYGKYSMYNVRGICFNNFGMRDYSCDFNTAAVNNYLGSHGELPQTPVYGDAGWLSFGWQEQAWFLDDVRSACGGWAISAIVDGRLVAYTTSDYTGSAGIGLNDDFSSMGWSSVGVPLAYRRRSDMSLRLRSLEYVIAYIKRFAKDSSPLFVLDFDTVSDFDTVFNMLAKYEATTLVFSDYRKFRMLNDAEVLALKAAMRQFRVSEKSKIQDIGLAVSSASLNTLVTKSGNKRWIRCVEDIASEMLDKLPHRLNVMFDADLETANYDVSAVIVPNPYVLSENAINVISESSLNYVICGENDGLYPVFGQQAGDSVEYSGGLFLGANTLDAVDDDYYTACSGNEPLIDGVAFATDGTGSVVPVFLKGRTSMVAMPAYDDSVLISLIGDLALYAVGR